MSDDGNVRDNFLFQHLILMFQTLALQQLGKLSNPISGAVERDLHQAKITIDMLGMLQRRTAGNLDEEEKRLLDAAVLGLQMNFVDESGRPGGAEAGEEEGGEPSGSDGPRTGASDGAGSGTESPDTDETG